MARIFVSHSGLNNPQAVGLGDWLTAEGWDDIFLDLDPQRGINAGDRWERALIEAVSRCEAAVFLVSRDWLASEWCRHELALADKLNKRLFGVLIEDIPIEDLPSILTSTWQVVSLVAVRDPQSFHVKLPKTGEETDIVFSVEGLRRLKGGLQKAGLDPRFFDWPPENDPLRPPYRGLVPLEAEDAGIFFGRDVAIVTALDTLRGLRGGEAPRFLVILGASGAGKSSFLRAGLIPRLQRDDRNFVALPVIRPDRAILSGETGLIQSLEQALKRHGLACSRAELDGIVERGADDVLPLLEKLVQAAQPPALAGEDRPKPPALVISIDQGEELFLAEGADEAARFFELLPRLLEAPSPVVIVIFTIRTDKYEPLQAATGPAKPLDGLKQNTLSLPPLPKGLYATVIEGPIDRLEATDRPLRIEAGLTQRLLEDIAAGDAKDSLPLLAFTLERLYRAHGAQGQLKLSHYEQLGGVKGSIEAAVEDALAATDAAEPRSEKLARLRAGFIPWLAGIDPETQAPRRRVALMSEIPAASLSLIRCLIEQRLLATDVARDAAGNSTGEMTVEPAHEALLRQCGLLQGWLNEEKGALITLESVKRAAGDWIGKRAAADATSAAPDEGEEVWLTHRGHRLAEAERVLARPDFASVAGPHAAAYIGACRAAENAAVAAEALRLSQERQQLARNRVLQRRGFVLLGVAFLVLVAGAVAVLVVVQNLNQRKSYTLAAMARDAYAKGFVDRAGRYALAGVAGADEWLIGFKAERAENALNLVRLALRPKGVLRTNGGASMRTAYFSPDSKRVVTASYDGTAAIWDVATGAEHPLVGHKGKVEYADFSPDGRTVVTASFDGTARLWDARTAMQTRELRHGTNVQVWRAAFSPNGARVATAAKDNAARLWDAATGELLHRFDDFGGVRFSSAVHFVVFSPDGAQLLATSEVGETYVWDARTFAPIKSIPAADGKKGTATAAYSPDGRLVAIGYAGGGVQIWNRLTGAVCSLVASGGCPDKKDPQAKNPHTDFVYAVRFNRASTRLMTASADKTAILWDVSSAAPSYKPLFTLHHDQTIRDAVFSPDDSEILTASDDASARLWDAATGRQIFIYRGHTGPIYKAKFSPDARLIVTASLDGTARLWDATASETRGALVLTGHSAAVRHAVFSDDGRHVATVAFQDKDDTARIWNAATGVLEKIVPVGDTTQTVAFSHDGKFIATGTRGKFEARIWDLSRCDVTGKPSCDVPGQSYTLGQIVMGVMFSPDDKRLLTASRDGFARVFTRDGSQPHRPYPDSAGLAAAAFSPDGKRILSVSYDDAVIWDVDSGRALCTLVGHNAGLRDAAFSWDGRFAVTTSEDHTARIWNVTACGSDQAVLTPIQTLMPRVADESIWGAAFSPDGRRVAVASETLSVAHIYDVFTGDELATIGGHTGAVYSVAFSRDGRRLLTASGDRTARITLVPVQKLEHGRTLIDSVCRENLRDGLSIFSPDELEQAPVLDPVLDRDPCHPASTWDRLVALF